MVIKIVEKDDEYYQIQDLVDSLKKNKRIDESGAIFTFEGFVRGTEKSIEGEKIVDKMILTTPDKEKAQNDLEKIVESVKIKYGVYGVAIVHFIGEFYTGDPLFLTAVLGPHRNETLDALKEVIERTKFDVDFKKEEISNTGRKIIMAGGK
ncbi:MAG: molybdenum cofactor biosynthesis protein MoaE [Methanobrevibacter arboriphilus]|uniref:Molybdenum cofactor biosynthesis protein MoaE n=2 Tax=Methanobrevibacter arboriphilus TaxID=39441 RepID=A0ACA8R1N0_METAZ|nr:molybdenum cofactor biosynthesis protein MoaE [Methanobrevibacter arboriphilus]MBF4468690.1 molybdenum cofactor biosynthesis protein MoaE [Methanobrevibacter arboriphilus]MCC7562308.1 molybdenum cofactor biosynthesis protein MoaE [Methanobrevibacter arboriphilus]BBL61039.1 molybdenum cofactor biosynthesis protein MoaE [Methanobrevibacter arboriphilus]